MAHLITLFYLIAACFGFFSLGTAFVAYRRNSSETIRRLLNLELALGSLFLCLSIWRYETNAIGSSGISEYLSLILHIVSYIALYCFTLLMNSVMGAPAGKIAKALLSAFLIACSLLLLVMPFSESVRSNPFLDGLDDLVILPIGAYVVLHSLIDTSRVSDARLTRTRSLARYVTLIAVIVVIGDTILLSRYHTIVLFPVSFVAWNVLFLKWINSTALLPAAEEGRLNEDKLAAAGITKREREIITRLLAGDSYATIANKEFISVHTVKSHVSSIYRKLNADNRYQLRDALR